MRRIMQIRKDVIHRDLHNFSYHTTTEFNNSVLLFIQNIFHFLTSLLPWLPVDFLLNFGPFFVTVSGHKRRFFSCRYSYESRQHPSSNMFCVFLLFAFSFTVEPLRNGHLGGQKKVTVVERFEKGSMYGRVRQKKWPLFRGGSFSGGSTVVTTFNYFFFGQPQLTDDLT